MKKETILAKGFFCENPRDGAPDYVLAKVSVKVPDAISFLNQHANAAGYVNLDLLHGNNGKPYLKLDEWKPQARQEASAQASALANEVPPEEEAINPEDIPF